MKIIVVDEVVLVVVIDCILGVVVVIVFKFDSCFIWYCVKGFKVCIWILLEIDICCCDCWCSKYIVDKNSLK